MATNNPQVMRLVKPNPDARPERDADRLLKFLDREAQPGPIQNQPFPDLGPRPNLFMRLVGNPVIREAKGAVTAFKTESITGAAVDELVDQTILAVVGDSRFTGDARDPNFQLAESPVVQEAFKRHPFLFDDAESGMLFDLQSDGEFARYLSRRLQHMQDVDELNDTNIVNRLFLTGIGQVGDIATGGLIFRAVGFAARGKALAQSIKNAAGVIRGTSRASRLTRVGSIGLANAAQELGINFISPNRPDKIDENVAIAGLFGLVIGGALEAAIMSGGKHMLGVSARHLNETLREARGKIAELDTAANLADEFKANEAFAQEVLDKPVTGPRTLNLYDTPQTNILAQAIQKKYDDAGQELILGSLDPDGFIKLTREMEGLNEEIFRRATAITLGKGVKTAKVGRAFQSLLDVVTPGGRLRRTSSDTVRRAHRTIFGDAEPSVAAIKDPVRADTPVSAESIMALHRRDRSEVRLALFKAIDDNNMAKKGPFKYTLSNGEVMNVNTRWQANQYYRSVIDYQRRLDLQNRKGVQAPKVPKAITDGATAHNQWAKLRANQLTQVKLMSVSESALKETRASFKKIPPEIRAVEAKIKEARAAANIPTRTKVGQAIDQSPMTRVDIDKTVSKDLPELGIGKRGVSDTLNIDQAKRADLRADDLEINEPGRDHSRLMARVFAMSKRGELKTENVGPLAGLRAGDLFEGDKFNIANRSVEVTGRTNGHTLIEISDDFDAAFPKPPEQFAIPHDKTIPANQDSVLGAPTKATAGKPDDATNAKIAKLVNQRKDQRRELKKVMEKLETLPEAIRLQENHISRRWLRDVIQRRREEFVGLLRKQFNTNRQVGYTTGKKLVPDERTLLADVVENVDGLDLDAVAEKIGKDLADLTEGDLRAFDGLFHNEYLKQVDGFRDRITEATSANMLDLKNAHGVEHAFNGPNALKNRLMEIDEVDFSDFLDDNLEQMLGAYDHMVSGLIATRRAIQLDAEYWGPEVKRLLNEDLTLETQQIIDAISKDYQNKIDLAARLDQGGVAKSKLQASLIKQANDVKRIFTEKINQFHGMKMAPGNPSLEVGWRFILAKNVLRFPAMAFLGKVMASSQPDSVNLMIYSRMNPEHFKQIGGIVTDMGQGLAGKKVSLAGLEGTGIGTDDGVLRTFAIAEVNQLPVSARFPKTLQGRAQAATDQTLDAMNRGFFRSTGMNRWNTAGKARAGRLVIWEMFDGAKRMAKADAFVKAGMPVDEAIRRAGFHSKLDATRLNRLGISGANAVAIVEQFRKFGVTPEGKQFSKMANDEFEGFQRIVYPNFQQWDNPGLVERLTASVNSEVDNLIVTPKALSRPLFVDDPKFGFIGPMIHQFQSFGMSFGNQLAPIVAQRPTTGMAGWLIAATGMGAVSDAIHNQLSGRRSFEETARLWTSGDPMLTMGMTYAAADRAGVFGWLARGLGTAEGLNMGPGALLGNNVSSNMMARNLSLMGAVGPFADWFDAVLQGGVLPLLDPDTDFDARRRHMLRKALPFQNHILLSTIYQTTKAAGIDNPFGRGKGIDLFPLSTLPENDLRRRRRPAQP